MQRSPTLERMAAQITTIEWTIYPTGTGAFACGSPDGRELRDGQGLEVLLGGRWIPGFIEEHARLPFRFIALDDQSACGLCAGMHIRLLVSPLSNEEGQQETAAVVAPAQRK